MRSLFRMDTANFYSCSKVCRLGNFNGIILRYLESRDYDASLCSTMPYYGKSRSNLGNFHICMGNTESSWKY